MTALQHALDQLQDGQTLSAKEAHAAVTFIMNGDATEEEVEAFLVNLSRKGETASEITGAARALREKAATLQAPDGALDCCGTGGDMSGTYNISTAVALTVAACGIPVAKHGNRAATSKSGTADVLEALGVNLDTPQDKLEEALQKFNFAFLMAPHHHTAMKYVAPVRKKLKQRTIFNLLGPLANPAGTRYQLIGVYDRQWLVPMAEALRDLGTKRAWLVHGSDGLDEITVTGPTWIADLKEDGTIEEKTLTPEDFGLPISSPEDLKGGTAEENALALRALLNGQKSAYRDIVLANTAAALVIRGFTPNLKDGVRQAADALDSRKALNVLEKYKDFCHQSA